jgi:cytochrome oxidase Cu insertion factor (SCO1/SenC/PrrC family)
VHPNDRSPDGRYLAHILLVMVLSAWTGCGRSGKTVPAEDGLATGVGSGQATPGPLSPAAMEPLRVLGEVPEFSLVDQDGNEFHKSSLQGKVWVATFIFTRCASTCPLQTAEFGELQEDLRRANDWGRVQLVSFTVDPAYDTPQVLKQYGQRANADFENWHFLTGQRGDLWDLSKDGFKMRVESARDAATLIAHSQMLVLVDAESKIRGYYAALSQEATSKLRKDIDSLLDQHSPHRADEVVEISVPDDVRSPAWLATRAQDQTAKAAGYKVFHDFRFSDQLTRSGITFRDDLVEDVKRFFKASHYDHGTGIAVADVDGDGLLDIYFVSQLGPNELWKNLGDGTFREITATAGVAMPEEVSVAPSFADIDNDGDADLYVTRVRAPNKLFLNDGTGQFQDVSQESGLAHVGHSSAATFFDYDRDGLLDLLLTNVGEYTTDQRGPGGYYTAHTAAFTGHLHAERAEESILFRNLDGLHFENVNEELGFRDTSWTGDATPLDANDDGWPDIYLLNMQGHDEYYENRQGKGFVKKSRELFPKTAWGSMGVKVFDYNRDGRLDLYVTDMHTDMVHDVEPDEEKLKMRRNLPINMLGTDGNHVLGNAFWQKQSADSFVEVSDEINAENYWPWGISVGDLNADGFDDVFIAASMCYDFRYGINSVLLNDRGEKFLDSEFVLGVEPRAGGTAMPWMELDCSGEDAGHKLCQNRGGRLLVWAAIGTRSSVIFDIDGDGDLDIVTNDFGSTPMVLMSDLQDRKPVRFLNVELLGSASNRDGLGALVELEVAGRKLLAVHDGKSGYLSQSRMPLYFGLGDAGSVTQIVVTWPSGNRQVVAGPIESGQTLTIRETVDPAGKGGAR